MIKTDPQGIFKESSKTVAVHEVTESPPSSAEHIKAFGLVPLRSLFSEFNS